jgi:hypothetical protein
LESLDRGAASHLFADPLLGEGRVGTTASENTAKMIPTGAMMGDFTASQVT